MVRVDMSPARAQISKRQRRRRKAAAVRLARARRAQEKELAAAEAAREARRLSIQKWADEEDRLERLRKDRAETRPAATDQQHPPARTVTFATQVAVTQIPALHNAHLPEPTSSPLGVAVSEPAPEQDDNPDLLTDDSQALLEAVQASGGHVLRMTDEWSDDDDDDGDPPFSPGPEVDVARLVTVVSQRPRRNPRKSISNTPPAPLESPPALPSSSTPANFQPVPVDSNIPCQPNGHASSSPVRNGIKLSKKHSKPLVDGEKVKPNITPTSPKEQSTSAPSSSENSRRITPSKVVVSISAGLTPPADTTPRKGKSKKKGQKRRKPDRESLSTNENPECNGVAETANSEKQADLASAVNSPKAQSDQNGSPASRKRKKRKLSHRESPSPEMLPPTNSRKSAEAVATSLSPTKAENGEPSPENGRKKTTVKRAPPQKDADDEEIDSMFGDLLKQRAAKSDQKVTVSGKLDHSKPAVKSPKRDKNGKVKRVRERPMRYTDDGLRILTYDDIAADQPKGLNGPCPFDCSCCF